MHRFLAPALLLLSFSTITHAEEPEALKVDDAKAIVDAKLVKPLMAIESERYEFGRGEQPRRDFRATTFDANVAHDSSGAPFFTFSTESKYGRTWRPDVTGCVYPRSGKIFVKRSKKFYAAERMLGKKAPEPAAETCIPAAIDQT